MMQRDGACTSLWQSGLNRYDTQPSSIDDQFFDVIIVGAGITGMTTALHLQETGLRCIVLEARTLCFGATGGTTAHLNTLLDTPYYTIAKNFDKDAARLVARAAKSAINLITSNIERYNIDCDYQPATAFLFSQDKEQTDELEKMRTSALDAGIDLAYTDSIPIDIKMEKALTVPGQGKFNPTRYVYALAEAFEALGGVILQECPVQEVHNTDTLSIHTDAGVVCGKSLIYATHIPPGINILNTRCAPYRSYAMAVTLKDNSYPEGLIYDMYDPYHYYRTQEIDGKKYLIAGGEDHKTGHEPNTNACFLRLEAHIRKHFAVKEVAYRWSSQYFEPTDGLPYIGHLPGQPGNILVATGFGGNGMIYGTVAALVFKELLLKEQEQFVKLFNPNRLKPIAGLTNFIRENADVVKKWAGKFFPSETLESFADLAPGEGKIVRTDDGTVAMYKDEQGELHAIDPVCKHMGCEVSWNMAERSWDCPCHGARYSADGEVLTGPADIPLQKIDLTVHHD